MAFTGVPYFSYVQLDTKYQKYTGRKLRRAAETVIMTRERIRICDIQQKLYKMGHIIKVTRELTERQSGT
jgi:hypothetical protein